MELDEPVPPLPDGAACHDLGRAQSVFILHQQRWRRIPDVRMYEQIMGAAGAEKNSVRVLSTWQFRFLPEGPELTAGDVPAILDLRERNADLIRASLLQ